MRVAKARGARENCSAITLDQAFDARAQLLDDTLLSLLDLRVIKSDIGRAKTVVRRVFDRLVTPGRVNQRFAGDAPPVEAGSAEKLLLDKNNFGAELAGADCRDVAAGTTPNDRDIRFD